MCELACVCRGHRTALGVASPPTTWGVGMQLRSLSLGR